jgi:hypothetical protein
VSADGSGWWRGLALWASMGGDDDGVGVLESLYEADKPDMKESTVNF